MRPLPLDRLAEFEAGLRQAWCSSSWWVRRGSCCCSFGLLGLRWCEVASSLREDVDVAGGRLFVRTGKRGHPRTVDAPSELLAASLSLGDASGVTGPREHVFTTRAAPPRPLTYQDIRRFVSRVTLQCFGERFTFHCFRHTAAVRVWNRTHDVLTVSRYLGHRSLHWTQAYLETLVGVQLGGPIAFCDPPSGLRIFNPDVQVDVRVPRAASRRPRGKAAGGGDDSAFLSDAEASLLSSGEVHDCQRDDLVPFKCGDGFMAQCSVCASEWRWGKGQTIDDAVRTRNRRFDLRKAEDERRRAIEVAGRLEEKREAERTRRSVLGGKAGGGVRPGALSDEERFRLKQLERDGWQLRLF